MLSARRMRTGTRGLLKMGRPSVALVGASSAPSRQAKASPSSGQQDEGYARAKQNGQQQPDGEQARRQTCIVAHLLQFERRGVGEEQDGQSEFRQRLYRFRLR